MSKARAVATGLAVVGVANVIVFYGGIQAYKRWPGRDRERGEQQRALFQDMGHPTEKQRLEIFRDLAKIWDAGMGEKEDRGGITKWRGVLLSQHRVKGDVLEVGVGTGRNLPFLNALNTVRSYHGLDLVEDMLEEAKEKTKSVKFPSTLVKADMHKLPFPDNCFDTIVMTFVICSSEDPNQLLAEAQRVLRPNGKILMLEHGPSHYWWMRIMTSFIKQIPDPKHPWENGCFDDRNPLELVREANMPVFWNDLKLWGHWYLISCGSNTTSSETNTADNIDPSHVFWRFEGAPPEVIPEEPK